MNKLKQYHKVLEIKTDYFNLKIPFERASQKRFLFNVHEMDLWFDESTGTYADTVTKKGGGNDRAVQKIQIFLV